MTARLVLATRNEHKVQEMRRLLEAEGLDVRVLDLRDVEVPDVAETGATFAENSALKAVAVAASTGLPAVADDSGICVDALNGMPGILSARWAGRHGDDRANLELLLAQVADVPDERRGAQFVCSAVLALPDGTTRGVEGVLRGRVVREPRGSGGFGYDPVFVPEGHEVTTAELSAEQKDAISHRGLAMRALVPVLRESLTG